MEEPRVQNVKTLAETDAFAVLLVETEDDDPSYHLEVGNVTVHFLVEEWDEFIDLIKQTMR
jgi:hypothetical protein